MFYSSFTNIGNFKDEKANNVDSDEAAHNELPHLNQLCRQIQLLFFSFLALYVLRNKSESGCSKLTTLFVNVSLKFQTLISEIS